MPIMYPGRIPEAKIVRVYKPQVQLQFDQEGKPRFVYPDCTLSMQIATKTQAKDLVIHIMQQHGDDFNAVISKAAQAKLRPTSFKYYTAFITCYGDK